MTKAADIRVGTAGWSIPRASALHFGGPGTHLERYARSLRCAEINSSFHRPHAAATYAKWRDSTPRDFRFAVKMPRTITHELKLQDAREPFVAFWSRRMAWPRKDARSSCSYRRPCRLTAPSSPRFWRSYARSTMAPSCASQGMRHGSRHRSSRCWIGTGFHGWQPIRHRCPQQSFRRAGRGSHTFGCMGHHGRTGRGITRTTSRRLRRPYSAFGRPRKCGVCSTIPQAAPPSRMPGTYANV